MWILPVVAALPWIAAPLVILWRARGSPTLADVAAAPPFDPPTLSVIIPARDEARAIARCVRSVVASSWPRLEVIVVDDRSTDDTAAIVRALAREHERVRLVEGEPLPEGWFGKQWACAQGARAAIGSLLLFTDADTAHASDLSARAVNALRGRALDLLSVAGRQELVTFWERVVQPHIFLMLAARYGGPREVNRSRRVTDKLANGQYLLFTRAAYDAVGGHAAVRDCAAEDQALAQLIFQHGLRSELVLGMEQLSTRMYDSLRAIVAGWTKNVYAASRHALPRGPLGAVLLAVLLPLVPLLTLAPFVVLGAALISPISAGAITWAAICVAIILAWWASVYVVAAQVSPLWALTVPLGAMVTLWIVLRAIARGRRVEWKGRAYLAR